MSSISEQISAVAKTTLANPLAVINALTKTAFDGIEKIIALNMNTVKQSLESSTTVTREIFAVSKPQDLIAFGTAQPHIEKIVSYGRELADISAQTRSEFLRSLTQSDEVITPVISHTMAKPAALAIAPKVEKKSIVESKVQSNVPSNKQLPLLVEAEVKVAKKAAPNAKKDEKLPTANKITPIAAPLDIKTVAAKPTPIAKPAAKKSVEPALIEAKPISNTTTKPATMELDATPVASNPEIVSAIKTTPLSESIPEKKTAVKMPFPASPIKKAAKPAFPTVSTRPAYKAKGSAATGAKKPVRQ